MKYPETNDLVHDWAYLPYWLFFLLAGFVCIVHPKLMDSLERNRRTSLAIAFLSIIFVNYVRWNGLEPWNVITNWRTDWRMYAYMAVLAVTAWSWVFTAIGYVKRYLNKKLPVLNYVNQAAYQPHKSYLVNMDAIHSIEGKMLHIDKYQVPISKYQKDDVMERIVNNKLLKR